ncbi:transcription initiation factor IIF, beta subunit-domain-containing protein, partial [Lenzites betulinus]
MLACRAPLLFSECRMPPSGTLRGYITAPWRAPARTITLAQDPHAFPHLQEHTHARAIMRFAAIEEHSADVHGNYEHWQPARDDSSNSTSESGAESDDAYDDLMQVEPGDGKLFMVKIPKHLMERWSAIDEEDILLATIRVYPGRAAPAHYSVSAREAAARPRIVLSLPLEDDDDRLGPDEYEMDMGVTDGAVPFNDPSPSHSSSSSSATAARARSATPAPRKISKKQKQKGIAAPAPQAHTRRRRRIALAGVVTHHCSLRAVLSTRMRERVRARSVAANTPKRQIVFLADGVRPVPSGGGVGGSRPFLGAADRMARASRHALLDMLFGLFAERPRWTFKALRERTRQPEAYLKEVLAEIAFAYRMGEHRGQWELTASYSGK